MRILSELQEHGVAMHPAASAICIEDGAVHFTDASGTTHKVQADHVIVAKGADGDLTLAEALKAEGFNVHSIGDANGVGYIEGAIRGAYQTVVNITSA
jgi:glycine/D-amino acid oxidase-like deaminating enzyme